MREGATVVLGEAEWEDAGREAGAVRIVVANGNAGVAVAAASAFLGRPVDSGAADTVVLPGRFEVVGTDPLEIWDGAHNPAGLGHLVGLLPQRDFVVVASILADKDVDEMLRLLGARRPAPCRDAVHERAGTPGGGTRAPRRTVFPGCRCRVRPSRRGRLCEVVERMRRDPRDGLAVPSRLPLRRPIGARTMGHVGDRISVYVFAIVVLAAIVALAFGAGWLVGKVLL